MAEQGLIQRVKAAVLKFPGWGGGTSGSGYTTPSFWGSWLGARYTHIDYTTEVGDLGGASLVMAAANWLGRVLPEAPPNVVQVDKDGMETIIPNHPAAKLWRKPNAFYSGTTLLKAFAYSWIVSGNPYILKVRNRGNQVTELWYVPPHMMRPLWPENGNEFISGYEYRVDGLLQIFEQNDVIHFRDGIDPNNTRMGLSPVASLMREVYTDQEVANYAALLMKNGAVPPVVISPKESINSIDVDERKIKEAYQRSTQGTERGKAFVSAIGVDVKNVGLSPSDLNLQQLRRLPEERLSAVIGVPAIVLGYGAGLDKATYSNARQLMEFATETYLVPLYRYIEEELTAQLLPDFQKNTENFKFSFDLSQVRALSEDQDALYNRLSVAYKGGWLKRSEVRELAGYEFEPEDEIYAKVSTEGDPMAEDDPLNPLPPQIPPPNEDDQAKAVEQKATDPDATGSDAVLDAAVPWLLKLGEDTAAQMIKAKPKVAIAHE